MKHILNEYFENIFVIAHPNSARYRIFLDRWRGLRFTLASFVNQGTDCMNLDGYALHNFENFPTKIALKHPLSRGQVACSLAHMLIYDQICKENLSNTLILEDDCLFDELYFLEDALNLDWDVLSLFSGFSNGSSIYESVNKNTKYTYSWDRQGTASYVLKKPEIARYILDKQMEQIDTADGVLCDVNIKILALYPSVCKIDNSPSIIVNGVY